MFFKGDFYHLLASQGFLKGVKYSSNKKKREENKKGKEDQSKMEKSERKNRKEEQALWNKQTFEPCMELL